MSKIFFKEKTYSRYRDYRKEYVKEQDKINVSGILQKDDSSIKDVRKKISEYLDSYPIDLFSGTEFNKESFINYVLENINETPKTPDDIARVMFVSKFRKLTGRQGTDEKSQIEYITKLCADIFTKPSINVSKLSVAGKNAKYIKDGLIVDNNVKKKNPNIRSLDIGMTYSFKNKHLNFYGMLKYTAGNGGGQNQTYQEVEDSCKEFKNLKEANTILLTILDGDYYNQDRFKFLIENYKTKTHKILKSDKIIQVLIPIIKNWLDLNFGKNNKDVIKEKERLDSIRISDRIRLNK
jgi:hypothetical protein